MSNLSYHQPLSAEEIQERKARCLKAKQPRDEFGPVDPVFAQIHNLFMDSPYVRLETKCGIIEIWDNV